MEYRVGTFGRSQIEPDLLVGHQQTVLHQLVVEARPYEGVERLSEALVDLAIESALPGVDEPARIPERAFDTT